MKLNEDKLLFVWLMEETKKLDKDHSCTFFTPCIFLLLLKWTQGLLIELRNF